MNLKAADIKSTAMKVKGPLRIQLENHLGQAIVIEALFDTARYVAKYLAGF